MAKTSTDILIRIYPLDEAQGYYPVEAEIEDGSRFSDGQLRLNLQDLLRYEADPEAYGLALFRALFTGEILRAYEKATTIAETESGGNLRVRLWVDEDAVELHAVPWERMYHLYKGTPLPLSASALTPFSRYTSLETKEPEPITEEPLQILVAVSNPENLPETMAAVDVAAEVENIFNSLKGLIGKKTLVVTVMPGVTGLPETMRREMTRTGVKIVDGPVNLFTISPQLINSHIFHFIGHGGYRRRGDQDGQVAIYLEKADGGFQASVDDEVVSMFTALGRPPHCVFLQSCETARRESDATSPFVGLGPKLVRAGIPALVAMQRQVPMDLARLFAGEFYTRLAEHGEVDRALNQARLVAFNKQYADWSIPVLFMRIRSGRLFGEEVETEEQVRVVKWWPVAVSLGLIATLLVAVLWFVIPKKDKVMNGQFNVAVAAFQVQDVQGNKERSEDGFLLANYLSGDIRGQFSEAQANLKLQPQVWGPEQTGEVEGETPEERQREAAALAERIRAHVLIYGVIVSDGNQSHAVPEFFVNHRSFSDASEITGEHELGRPVKVILPFSESIQPIENPTLAGRANALDLITIGLAYYSVEDFNNAVKYFQQAADEERWLKVNGKEVVYLLLGNAYVRWASKDDTSEYLPDAAENYAEALQINPDYGRGIVGQANVLYLDALGSLSDLKIDPVKLDQAEAMLNEALALQGQPESYNIASKAHFQLGQVFLARYQAQVPGSDWLSLANAEFAFMVDDYESGDEALTSLAGHAYYRQGVIAYMQNDPDTAITLIKEAIPLVSRFYQGEYYAGLGDIYKNIGQKEQAIQAYEDALALAETDAIAEKYQQKLNVASGH
jgi:tetratricopeptide (TPR) repeat protein